MISDYGALNLKLKDEFVVVSSQISRLLGHSDQHFFCLWSNINILFEKLQSVIRNKMPQKACPINTFSKN